LSRVPFSVPGRFGSGISFRMFCACGESRPAGIVLFVNCVRVAGVAPLVGS